MSSSFKNLLTRNFNNPEMFALLAIIAIISMIIYFFGQILAPVFLSIMLAYLLNFPLQWLVKKGMKRGWALTTVFLAVICAMTFLIMFVGPLLIRQLNNLIQEAPSIVNNVRSSMQSLYTYLSPYVPQQIIVQVYENLQEYVLQNFDVKIDNILRVLQNVVYIVVNVFLVPFMSFLILVDYNDLKKTITRYLPSNRKLADGVFKEFLGQLDNYVKGKVIEFLIMTILSYVCFWFFDLKYNLIISTIIGISVIIPYVGIIIATAPLLFVGYFQFQLSNTFYVLLTVHAILQIFNGNILVPYLYSKANNLKPFTIIVAVLFFGQIWGIVGVFLAIPLATLFKALGNAWLVNSKFYQELQEKQEQERKAAAMTTASTTTNNLSNTHSELDFEQGDHDLHESPTKSSTSNDAASDIPGQHESQASDSQKS